MDIDSIMSMNCDSQRSKLRELGLDTTGLKTVLRDRLLRHFGHQGEGDDAESTNSEYQDLDAGAFAGVRSRGPVFTLKDIVESVSSFNGTDSLDVGDWKNSRRTPIQYDGIVYKSLFKDALIEEFGEKMCSAEIHKKLRNRHKNANETYREYVYALMEIGKPINLDVPSLLDYFVEGIPDQRCHNGI